MVKQTPSRKKAKTGDLFFVEMVNHKFVLGRVVRVELHVFGPDNLLLYFYSPAQPTPDIFRPPIKPTLLIAPRIASRQGWVLGYYVTLGTFPMKPGEELESHCFEDPLGQHGKYCDEYGKPLKKRSEPCGFYAMGTYRTIDDDLSEALGIPRAPDDETVR